MLHTKSGIPRPITKRKTDAGGGSKTSNERNDCVRAITTDTIKDSHIEANSGHIAGCSESSNAKVACKTTRATKTGRHLVTSSKESLPTNLEVVEGSDSESSKTKPVPRRTLINAPPASRAKNVAVIGASDVKVTDCRVKSLAGGLQVAPNPKSRHSLKTVAMPTASRLLHPNLLSYDHGIQNGEQKPEIGSDESCQSIINDETTQSDAKSLNKFLQLFIGETETLAESLNKEITVTTE